MKAKPKPRSITTLADLTPQSRNANRHTQRGMGELEREMRSMGYTAAMTAAADGGIFDGSARLEKAAEVFGIDAEPIIVHSNGTRPIIHVRDDIPTASDPRAVRASLAANWIAAHNLDPDAMVLAAIQREEPEAMTGLIADDELTEILGRVLDAESTEHDEPTADDVKMTECPKCGHVFSTMTGRVPERVEA